MLIMLFQRWAFLVFIEIFIDYCLLFFRDARIAALEKGSVETEKIIAEARTDKLKHLEEVYQANKRSAELEAK